MRKGLAEIISSRSRYYSGRGPTEINVQVKGSVITVRLVGMLSAVERNLLDFGRVDLIDQIREAFIDATGDKLCQRLREELGLEVCRVTRGNSDYKKDIGVLKFYLM